MPPCSRKCQNIEQTHPTASKNETECHGIGEVQGERNFNERAGDELTSVCEAFNWSHEKEIQFLPEKPFPENTQSILEKAGKAAKT